MECEYCHKPVKDHDDVIVIHKECYTQLLEDIKECGIRIGIRIHKQKHL